MKASENIFPQVRFSEETTLPTPATDEYLIGVKTDGKAYLKNDAGTETDLTGAGGGGGGELVLLSEQELVSDGTITFSSIPATYQDLLVTGRLRGAGAVNVSAVTLRMGATTVDSGSTSYAYGFHSRANNGTTEHESAGASSGFGGLCVGGNHTAGIFSAFEFRLIRYADSTYPRMYLASSAGYSAGSSMISSHGGGYWNNTTNAVDILTFASDAFGNLESTATLALFGVGIP